MQSINWSNIDTIIHNALEEDIGSGDITTASVAQNLPRCTANIISKNDGTLAGLVIAERAFKLHDESLHIERHAQEGEKIKYGQILMKIEGPGAAILEVERTVLNILGRCSGIATATNRFVEAVANTKTIILDTRKTAPLLRELDKYSVRTGGGQNHRSGLYDMILIKENHIRFAGGLRDVLENVIHFQQHNKAGIKIEVEVTNFDELELACRFPLHRIMLDNFTLPDLAHAVSIVRGAIALEASGGVNLETVAEIAATGVDFISVGALTHSVKNADFSLLFD